MGLADRLRRLDEAVVPAGPLVPPDELYGPFGVGVAFLVVALLPPVVDAAYRELPYVPLSTALALLGVAGVFLGLRRPSGAAVVPALAYLT